MKKFAILIGLIASVTLCFGQITQKVRKVVQVMPQQSFYLNGGLRATFGGKSRTYYKIDLPKNTIEWYYTFTTQEGNVTNSAALNLVPQLTRLFDPSGATALAASAIIAPTGSNSCDIYLMDRQNADAFVAKVDNTGGGFTYTISGSRENFRNGTIQIRDVVKGSYFLGFKNPSTSTGISVAFEVAAVVEEIVVNNNEWSNDTKGRLYSTFYQNLKNQNIDDEIAKDLANCLMEKISSQKTPAEYDKMIQGERDMFVSNLYSSCSERYKEQRTLEQEKAITYGNLGWKHFENGDLDKCIEYSKKALIIDNTLGSVKANLGLCYLIKGDEGTATDYYIEAIGDIRKIKLKAQVKYYLNAVIDDINNAQKKYLNLNGASSIKSLFEEELKNY